MRIQTKVAKSWSLIEDRGEVYKVFKVALHSEISRGFLCLDSGIIFDAVHVTLRQPNPLIAPKTWFQLRSSGSHKPC